MFDGWFINLGPSSTTIKEANADINAILDAEPDFAGGVESIGKGSLPDRKGYFKIRDRTPDGRANVFVYLRTDAEITYEWEDGTKEFPREPGTPGMHPARSFVHFNYRRVQFTFAHHPPDWSGAGPARRESLKMIRESFAPWRTDNMTEKNREAAKQKARILLWDRNMNMMFFRQFAATCDAWPVGDNIDSAMIRNIAVVDQGYQRQIGGHTFATDHPWGAFRIRFNIAKK